MGNGHVDSYDPYQEMKEFYRLDDPTEDEQFRFVEAMEYLIKNAFFDDDIIAFSYNLAIYYRDIQNFPLEKKYLEMGEKKGSSLHREELGLMMYYGLCDEPDYKRAYEMFRQCDTRRASYMIADMYHYGHGVAKDLDKCREILEGLFADVECERNDDRFLISTLFPEIADRLVRLNIEEEMDDEFDLDCLFDAREILANRQCHRPFWGNVRTMKSILETTEMMCGDEFDFIDLYDLLTFKKDSATVTFDYEGKDWQILIFRNGAEIVYSFEDRWFHGAEDFLVKARIEGKRITTVFDLITNIGIS